MFAHHEYALLDFGEGRKLETFGKFVLDRPCPVASRVAKQPQRWAAEFCYHAGPDGDGTWTGEGAREVTWTTTHKSLCFQLSCTPAGQVGMFPEQAENWDWIAKQVARHAQPMRVLNLFAYTGGSTLTAAALGAEVVHVEAARNVMTWARRNAKLSGLADAPIRWLTEDVRRFVRREVKRGQTYDAVILDPPSYGHGPKNEVWQLRKHLMPLLRACAVLTLPRPKFVLLTCHTPGFGPAQLQAYLSDAFFGDCQAGPTAKTLYLRTDDGRKLASGAVCRWPK
jgi:23S rRNA (cytosine1962-C5)-methyltransferase